jgi:hypothetical protein
MAAAADPSRQPGDASPARFTPAEERALREAVAAGALPPCPRCAVPMTWRAIGGGSFGLGYQRQRDWLLCPACRRSALFDRRRGTRL